MERHCNLNEISDGKRYQLNDMVKVNCGDCKGCSACCEKMGTSIVLDPLDVARMVTHLGQSLESLLTDKLELNVVDGMILPNLKMSGEKECCPFLNEAGRCSIHAFRPGMCRIFPLGRIYENRSFDYILQVNECKKVNRTKVKVSKWIDTKDLKKNQQYILDWHYFLKDLGENLLTVTDEQAKQINLYLLKNFYLLPFTSEETFYEEFKQRLSVAKNLFGL